MVYEHGGDIYRNKVRLDFSVNTNPLGMSENVKKAIAENIEQFVFIPDAMCVNLRNAIAGKRAGCVDNVLCSNQGAAEMIFAGRSCGYAEKIAFVGTYIFRVRESIKKRGFANLLLLFERRK